MRKVNLWNCLLYLLAKYAAFFLVLAFVGDRFQHLVLDKASTSGQVLTSTAGYVLYVLFGAAMLSVLVCAPIYMVFRLEKGGVFLVGLLLFFGVDYAVYTWLCSPSNAMLGLYNILVGVLLLGVLFHQPIKQKFRPNPVSR
jgi:hypothetical protein